MLGKQAAGRPAAADTAPRRAEAKVLLNKTLLSTMHYLAEFAKELNGVLPTTESPYGFIHLQQASPMVLSSAFADYRLCKVDGDEVCEQIFLTYQARYAQPAAMDVAGARLRNCAPFPPPCPATVVFVTSNKKKFCHPPCGGVDRAPSLPP